MTVASRGVSRLPEREECPLTRKIARYFEKIEEGKVHCSLCPHNCVIKPGQLGACRARKNIEGELYSLNYGEIASISLDRIEKKPLYRFKPGSMILSAGTFGCNMKCSFCQNWSIAHKNPDTISAEPGELVEKAMELRSKGNIGIAYTYNEPSIWFEFVLETSKLAKRKGLDNVLVTNGFISKEPLLELLPYVDAMNIDLKAYTDSFYNEICKATLENVKETISLAAGKCHIELTTLLIPGLNDDLGNIEAMASWIASVSPEITLHLSRFFPNYLMNDRPATPVETLEKAKAVAQKHLKYVYLGNV